MNLLFFQQQENMILPIRCYTCGKVLANLTMVWEQYKKESPNDWLPFFEKYKIQRYCCKRILMAQVTDPNHIKTFVLPSSIHISSENECNMFIAH